MTSAEYKLHPGFPKQKLKGDLWGVFCEYSGENLPHYNGTALCLASSAVWTLFYYKSHLSRYKDSHFKDKLFVRPSYVYNGISKLINWHRCIETSQCTLQAGRDANKQMLKSGWCCCQNSCSWWRHQMETFSALLAICAGNSPVTGEFPSQRPVMRSFDVFFDLRLNKWLSKQSWDWWF